MVSTIKKTHRIKSADEITVEYASRVMSSMKKVKELSNAFIGKGNIKLSEIPEKDFYERLMILLTFSAEDFISSGHPELFKAVLVFQCFLYIYSPTFEDEAKKILRLGNPTEGPVLPAVDRENFQQL